MYRPKTVSKRPSGAAFRKRKIENEVKDKSSPKITKHFFSQSVMDKSHASSDANDQISGQVEDLPQCTENSNVNDIENDVASQNPQEKNHEERINIASSSITHDTQHITSSDIGLFLNLEIDATLREKILSLGPCRPTGPFPKNATTHRSFSIDYYYVNHGTKKIPRQWLCYSSLLDAVYCEVCWLFADRNDKSYKESWASGTINNWQALSKKLKTHETCAIHLQACIAQSTYKKNKNKIKDQFEKEHEKWREVLLMILDTLVTMATCTIPLRGHRENPGQIDVHSGNFLNIIELLARHNPLMKNHLQNQDTRTKHLAPCVQNELLELAAGKVLKTIISDIREADFFSLILDTTQDISKKDQLSLVIRHVQCLPETGLVVKESFLGFIEVFDQGAGNITAEVLKFLEDKNIDISRCRGQGYDGASVMSGEYSGIQARIKAFSPQADYMHCANHNLNLVVNDCVDEIIPIKSFYGNIEQLYLFFSKSLPRWQKLIDNANKNGRGAIVHALKKLCPTRWSSRFESTLAIKQNFSCVLNALTTVVLLAKKKSEADDASALLTKISQFEFVLMLVFQYNILEHVNHLAKILQHSDIKLDEACKWLKTVLDVMKTLRLNFEHVKQEAEALAKSLGILPTIALQRKRKVKRFHDELALDEPISEPLRKFQIEVFNRALDLIIQQLQTRFQSMNIINEYFSFLNPESLLSNSNDDLIKCADSLQAKYNNDIDETLATEIISFRNLILMELTAKKITTFQHITDYLFVEHVILQSSFPNLCKALLLYLTLPVTSASAEKSFSKLKLIKTYLSNNMGQIRLSSIGVLSIEHALAKKLNLNEIIDEFLEKKCRRGLH